MPPEEAWLQPLVHHVELHKLPHAGELPGTLTHEGVPDTSDAARHDGMAHNRYKCVTKRPPDRRKDIRLSDLPLGS